MELPDIGRQCSLSTCQQLDYLPFQCEACHLNFCKLHWKPTEHRCSKLAALEARRDVRVVICPACNNSLHLETANQDPNIVIDRHLTSGQCKGPVAQMYANSCSFPNCKKHEAVPIRCHSCRNNFCLRHRLEVDHNCAPNDGSPASRVSSFGALFENFFRKLSK